MQKSAWKELLKVLSAVAVNAAFLALACAASLMTKNALLTLQLIAQKQNHKSTPATNSAG